VLCAMAWSMGSLIAFRGIQGLGAGAITPIAMTIAGDIYTVRERAKAQGYVPRSFSSSEAGSHFQCRLDGASFAACSSPKAYSGLGSGAHRFKVRAIDRAGNVDRTPAIRDFSVQP